MLSEKRHCPSAWSIDKYQAFLPAVQVLYLEEKFCLYIDFKSSETMHQWRIMYFTYIQRCISDFSALRSPEQWNQPFFLLLPHMRRTLLKIVTTGQMFLPAPSWTLLAASFCPGIHPHTISVSLVPRFSNTCMFLMRSRDRCVSSRGTQIFPLCLMLFPTVF